MVHVGQDTMIDLVFSLDHPIDIIGDMHLDMKIQITETTIVNLVIGMGISGTEVTALDTIIMGIIGQIVDLVNNGRVKATTRTVTKITTTIMANKAMVRTNITSVVERDKIGVIVNMTTILNKMVIMDANHNHIVAMVKMTPVDIRELKTSTFPYLSNDDVCLSMSDRNIVRKELDLDTDSELTDNDKQSIRDFYYSMRECLSTPDNPSIQNKSFVSLKTCQSKTIFKPYLTHESEIKFAEAEMEKLREMGILLRGSSEFLSPIMLIKKSHSGVKLAKSPEYHLVVDFKYLNSHLLTSNSVIPRSNTY